jgi:hypothetical protein
MSELHHKREGIHTKAASSTPASLGIGAAEARAITKKKVNVNFRIQKVVIQKVKITVEIALICIFYVYGRWDIRSRVKR